MILALKPFYKCISIWNKKGEVNSAVVIDYQTENSFQNLKRALFMKLKRYLTRDTKCGKSIQAQI